MVKKPWNEPCVFGVNTHNRQILPPLGHTEGLAKCQSKKILSSVPCAAEYPNSATVVTYMIIKASNADGLDATSRPSTSTSKATCIIFFLNSHWRLKQISRQKNMAVLMRLMLHQELKKTPQKSSPKELPTPAEASATCLAEQKISQCAAPFQALGVLV